MVRLDRIYTKTGDDGTTGLGDGTRVEKHHPRVAAYGTVDELSSVLGLALAHELAVPYRGYLLEIQNDLFDVGADLCVPGAPGGAAPSELEKKIGQEKKKDRLRVTPAYTKRLEEIIDLENAALAPLSSFILPGGTQQAAWMHLARNVCRRAERHVTELLSIPGESERVNIEVLRYLNRLSDLLFVLARLQNNEGRGDVLWKPGERQSWRAACALCSTMPAWRRDPTRSVASIMVCSFRYSSRSPRPTFRPCSSRFTRVST
jgi:cob(I)alamin adenosyltransferase